MKIAVLMSGGIDSSFAALYFKKQGFDVVGITFLHYSKEVQKNDIERAKKVAREIKIPHFVFDIREKFKGKVIEPFLDGYKNGTTPNLCPFCNKEIKFGLFLKEAKKLGAEMIATGHYAREKELKQKNKAQKPTQYFILKAKDKSKDQSYFLWQLNQKELKRILFPLGEFTKESVLKEVRNSKIGKFFPKKDYKESQDICFLKNESLREFLENNIKKNIGPILDKDGKKIGEHDGIFYFTIGQRSGIKIGAKSPKQKPLYVIGIKPKKNAIVVGEEKYLYKKELFAKNINWVSGESPKLPFITQAQIRYGAKPAIAKIKKHNKNTLKIEFKKNQRAITPGQHIVFYKRGMLLGGGVMVNF